LITVNLILNSKALEAHSRNCIRDGAYVEGQLANNRIAELKTQDYNRRWNEFVDG